MSIRGYFFRTKRLIPRLCVITYPVARRNARESPRSGGIVLTMAYVVTESCIKCKYTDCVDVCPVDCFREGPNMLVIDPEECIDCTLCVPECPVEAIFARTMSRPRSANGFHQRRALQALETHRRAQARPGGRRGVGEGEGKEAPSRTLSKAR